MTSSPNRNAARRTQPRASGPQATFSGGSGTAHWCVFLLVALLVIVHSGCGGNGESAIVTGVVTLDGAPLERGIVTFAGATDSLGAPASGQIQGDGSYQVQIGQSGKVIAGEYVVTVAARAPSIESPNGGPPTPGPLLTPEKYTDANRSGLRYHIRPGRNVIDIALTEEDNEDTSVQEATGEDAEENTSGDDAETSVGPEQSS